MTYYLVALDVTGIQTYLFGSNRLVENIGASEIVAQATEQWVFDTAQKLELRHNFSFSDKFDYRAEDWFDETKSLEAGNVDLEVMFAGGGNAVLMFSDVKQAKRFIQSLTEKAIQYAPGLKIAVSLTSIEMTEQVLKKVYDELWEKLAKQKEQQQPSMPLLGVSVTADCNSTGLPAIAIDKDDPNRLLSAEVVAKLNFEEASDKRLKSSFLKEDYKFEKDFNFLGEKDKSSYLAVVHADGNGIGNWLKGLTEECNSIDDNRNFIKVNRNASQKLRRIAVSSMQVVVEALFEGVKSGQVNFSKGYDTLPFRPLIVSGDDTTFVCEGDLGLSLAVIYLKAFKQKTAELGFSLRACAGVAIVPNHYPFARAYNLSEALVKKAKRYVQKKVGDDEQSVSVIDWHFAINGLIGELTEIRQQEYKVTFKGKEANLSLRPLQLTEEDEDAELRSWENCRNILLKFQSNEWQSKRNKLKMLREILRDGAEATKHFLTTYKLGELPETAENTRIFQQTGWDSGGIKCGYFDAIEAVDHFIDLEATTR